MRALSLALCSLSVSLPFQIEGDAIANQAFASKLVPDGWEPQFGMEVVGVVVCPAEAQRSLGPTQL